MEGYPSLTLREEGKPVKELFIGKCWQYLYDNFHKFSEPNRIKIALELSKKSIPTQLEHSGEIKYTKMPEVKVNRHGVQELLTFNIGN